MKRIRALLFCENMWLYGGEVMRVRLIGAHAWVHLMKPEDFWAHRDRGEPARGITVSSPQTSNDRWVTLKAPRSAEWYVLVQFTGDAIGLCRAELHGPSRRQS